VKPIDASEAPDLFRAFADETRLRLLHLLACGEVCVCQLCEVLEQSQPKISRHLAYLRRVGLVSVRQQGKWKHYSIAKELGPLQKRLVGCVASCLGGLSPLTEDKLRLAEACRDKACARGSR